MTIQDARIAVEDALDPHTPSGWRVTLDTDADKVATGTIMIGHATTITRVTMKTWSVELTITLWVNEFDSKQGVVALYELMPPSSASLEELLRATDLKLDSVVSGNVGRRDEGPTGFLAADVTISMRFDG